MEYYRAALMLTSSLIVSACLGETGPLDSDSSYESSTERWSTLGGYIFSADGLLAVDAPAGVVHAATDVTIESRLPNLRGQRSPLYRLTTAGTPFRTPLTLYFDLDPDQMGTTELRRVLADGSTEPLGSCVADPTGLACYDLLLQPGQQLGLFDSEPGVQGTITATRGIYGFSLGSKWGCVSFHRTPGEIQCWGAPPDSVATAPRLPRGLGRTVCAPTERLGPGLAQCFGPDAGELTPPAGLQRYALSVGRNHSCVLHSGTYEVHCFGDNSSGQLNAPLAPAPVVPPSRCRRPTPRGGYYSVSAGHSHTCALRHDSRMTCWGEIDGRPASESTPDHLFDWLSSSGLGTCGRTSAGQVICWGGGLQDVPDARFRYGRVAVGASHACGLLSDQTARCWGPAASTASPPLDLRFRSIRVGQSFTCGVPLGAFDLKCWGLNDVGQASPPQE